MSDAAVEYERFIWGCDPGGTTGLVLYDSLEHKVVVSAQLDIDSWLDTGDRWGYGPIAVSDAVLPLKNCVFSRTFIEDMTPGKTVGHDVLNNAKRVGRIYQSCAPGTATLVRRMDVRRCFTGQAACKPSLVLAGLKSYLCDIHRITEKELKGTAKNPGPCFGVAGHAWDALAVAVYGSTLG